MKGQARRWDDFCLALIEIIPFPLGEAYRAKLSNCSVSFICLATISSLRQLLVLGAASVTLTCSFKESIFEAVSLPCDVPSS